MHAQNKGDDALVDALSGLLDKHGLSARSGDREIAVSAGPPTFGWSGGGVRGTGA